MKAKKLLTLLITAVMLFSLSVTVAADQSITTDVVRTSSGVVREGGTVTYEITYTGDVAQINLVSEDIACVGFSAEISVSGDENTNKRTITLENVTGTGEGKYIRIGGGTAGNSMGLSREVASTEPFTVKPKAWVTFALWLIIIAALLTAVIVSAVTIITKLKDRAQDGKDISKAYKISLVLSAIFIFATVKVALISNLKNLGDALSQLWYCLF